jgi:hypothetical protein
MPASKSDGLRTPQKPGNDNNKYINHLAVLDISGQSGRFAAGLRQLRLCDSGLTKWHARYIDSSYWHIPPWRVRRAISAGSVIAGRQNQRTSF